MTQPHTPHCPHCNKTMEPGYTVDRSDGGLKPTKWTPGTPATGFWKGIREFRKPRLPVTVFRCPRCGMLQSYALG